jgi:TonB family protein
MLNLVDYEPVHYPPLARQTRTSGVVKVRVVVDASGAVSDASPVAGHPLLVQVALDDVRHWKFEPIAGSQVEFEVIYEFLLGNPAETEHLEVFFDAPQRVRIVSSPPPQQIIENSVASRTS